MNNYDIGQVNAYLHFGYLPDPEADLSALLGEINNSGFVNLSASSVNENELVAIGVDCLKKAFGEAIREAGIERTHVIPLSGGLDSRAILCGLIENVDRSRIKAVTFGSPGTLDYEIGRMVAIVAGVEHQSIDLTSTEWKWSIEGLTSTAVQTEGPIWLFDAYVNRHMAEWFGKNCVYWSGFMGDPLAGSHLLARDSSSWSEARTRFTQRNQFCRRVRLSRADFDAEMFLPDLPFASPTLLSYDEQIDFSIRQQCWIKKIVLPKGYDYRTPFLQPRWVHFILGVPRYCRERQRLYKRILRVAYPEIFSLPTKANLGLPLGASWYSVKARKLGMRLNSFLARALRIRRASPFVNYIDFDWALRERKDLKTLVYEEILALKKRKILNWIDIETLWEAHQKGRGDFADALTLLASLEINLKAGYFCEGGNDRG
ncbi:MAG: asparagine synthase-related protein [candidate division WOR-3 bacterium]